MSDCVCETRAPPAADWNVNTATTGSPRRRFSAFRSAFMAERVGLIVKLIAPAAGTLWLPFANTIRAGRHLRLNLMEPLAHLTFLDAKTPNLPFWNVSSHLKVPALASEPVKVIAPVDPSTLKLRTLKSPFDVSPAPGAEDPEAGLPPEPPLPEPPVPCPCPP